MCDAAVFCYRNGGLLVPMLPAEVIMDVTFDTSIMHHIPHPKVWHYFITHHIALVLGSQDKNLHQRWGNQVDWLWLPMQHLNNLWAVNSHVPHQLICLLSRQGMVAMPQSVALGSWLIAMKILVSFKSCHPHRPQLQDQWNKLICYYWGLTPLLLWPKASGNQLLS